MHVLALDVGTSVTRALVFDDAGKPVGRPARHRHVGVKDPDELARGAEQAIASAGHGRTVEAVAVSTFWHSLLPLDGQGRPLTEILGWSDLRATEDAERLAQRLDAEAVYRRTGCVLHPSYWPAKLAWLARTDPELFARAARFVSFADYLLERLAGDGRTSLSMASGTGLLDEARDRWDVELLEVLGIDEDKLPAISDEPIGDAVPFFPGLGDGACSNVGVGAVTRERATLTIGTSGALRTIFTGDGAEPVRGLFLYRLDAARYVEGGAVSDADNLLFWLRDLLRLGKRAEALEGRDPDAHGLTFLPLLGGERSPGWNPRARGAIAGLRLETTALDVLQAALEGMAYRFAEIADLMPAVQEVVLTGGALAASSAWAQLLADVLGQRVVASCVAEASARGAAVVALERLGHQPQAPRLGSKFEPDAGRGEVYAAARARQRKLYRGAATLSES